ncbi:hypothetical protein F2P81_013095 [Scophthalmus maximus]|uniref:Uncharacterized protein n=1 Tax=Scophthalmus maximus TaxID=52904 RepID=A0A6A4SPX9_SCOMX|nr:hypothetical protein F2P81_013095 [Scophthalmus maximus]
MSELKVKNSRRPELIDPASPGNIRPVPMSCLPRPLEQASGPLKAVTQANEWEPDNVQCESERRLTDVAETHFDTSALKRTNFKKHILCVVCPVQPDTSP